METTHTETNINSKEAGIAATDTIVISQGINDYYLKGIYEGDLNLLSDIYYPGTLILGDVKGKPYFKTLSEYLQAVSTRISPRDSGKPFQGEIISIKIVNSIAVAELKVRMYDFYYHEFLSIHKVEGRWLIVNKMMSDLNLS